MIDVFFPSDEWAIARESKLDENTLYSLVCLDKLNEREAKLSLYNKVASNTEYKYNCFSAHLHLLNKISGDITTIRHITPHLLAIKNINHV